jgi:xanthine dehydrogenase YagR molybdenum-binding subunit
MAEIKWPQQRRVIGTKVPRVDGPDKATGLARYGFDINRRGMLHAMILRSSVPHGRLKTVDVSAAEKHPGFRGIYYFKREGQEVFYVGDEILAIAADTEEHCHDCLRLVRIEYEPLPFVVTEEAALKEPGKGTVPNPGQGNVRPSGQRSVGNVEDAFGKADAVVEGTYSVPVQCHCCLEPHGMVAEWQGNNLTVWCSTQATTGIASMLEAQFRNRIPDVKCRCITHYMGGGYGSKFIPGPTGIACSELALMTKAPVKLFLDRFEEQVSAGNRPSATATVKIAGTKDGKITAFQADIYGTPGGGAGAGAVDAYHQLMPYVYTSIPNIRTVNRTIRLNTGDRQAFRAPGHPQACFLTESAVDDLANKLGLDPLEVRRANLPTDPPNAFKKPIYEEQLKIVAEMCDWKKRWHPPGQGPSKGPLKHGIGLGLHTWGGGGRPNNDVRVTIKSNGSVLVQCSTQDLGTGERTVLAIVVAEVLGLNVKDVTSEIGESQFGRSTGSGGSTTCPGTAPAALIAAHRARDDLFAKLAPRLGVNKDDLKIDPAKPGKIVAGDKEWTWKEACARLGMDTVVGIGDHPGDQSLSSQGVGGVQVCECWVDTETGLVYLKNFWAVQDCGLVINKLACESQVAGGIIMGIHYAMFEERLMDDNTGRPLNADMEFYKLAGMKDIPEIHVHMMDMPERGVIGIGEPPTISTAAAIGNAICNALGVRVPRTPFSPMNVLAALAQKGGA